VKHIRQQIRGIVEGTWSAWLAFDKRNVYVTDQLNKGLIEEQEFHVITKAGKLAVDCTFAFLAKTYCLGSS